MFVSSSFNSGRGGAGGGIGCLIFGVLGLVATYYILKGVFAVLWWAAPVLFIAALLINWRVVAGAGKALLNLFRTRPLTGLILAILAVVAFPVLALFLFLSALGGRRMETFRQQFGQQVPFERVEPKAPAEGEFIDFEELESRPTGEPVEPPKPVEKEAKKPENPYEDLFKS